jgi:hypothetical protein
VLVGFSKAADFIENGRNGGIATVFLMQEKLQDLSV